MTKNHFEVLGLKPGVLEDEIKKTYRTLAKKWHPDKNKDPGAEEKFKEISVSYEYLISKDRREILERDLRKKSEAPTTGTYKFWSHNDFGYTSTSTGKPDAKAPSGHSAGSGSKTKTETKENTKPSKPKTHWSDSFTSKNKNKSRAKPSKPMYDEPFVEDLFDDDEEDFQYSSYTDQEFYSRPKPRGNPNFSFAFKSFVDQLDSELFFPAQDQSYNRFGNTGISFLNAAQPPPKPRKREVAPENGFIDGLDEEYFFTPPQSNPQKTGGAFNGTYKCNFCQKYFTPSKLIEHEIKCGKWLNEDDEDDIDDIDYSQAYPAYTPTRKPHADWQDSRNDLHEQIRQAKKMAKMKAFQEKESIICKYCGIGLSKNVADRHILFCERKNSKFKTSDGKSKTERAKQYASDIPSHRYSGRHGDDGEGDTENRTKKSHSSKEKMGKAQSTSEMPYRPHSSSSKSKRPSSGLGINGEKFGSKKPGAGCASCSQKYGTNAKFYCSCGTKRSTFS